MKHEFCDHCPGCRPALVDLKTGNAMAADSEIMILVNRVWNTETTYAERKAFIDVTVHNSVKPDDFRLASGIMAKIERATK